MDDAALRPGISLEHFKNERDYIAQRRPSDDSTVAAMDWARAEIEQLQELLRGVGANRYWEGRWRDGQARIERLEAMIRGAQEALGEGEWIAASDILFDALSRKEGA